MIHKILIYGLTLGGALSITIGLFHTYFYRFFNWEDDFSKISILNARVFCTIHIATILFLIGFGFLSIQFRETLSEASGLAAGICIFYSLFWLWRLLWQVIYFNPSKIELDSKLLVVYYMLVSLFAILFIVYGAPVFINALN